jgi:hypothetical protein
VRTESIPDEVLATRRTFLAPLFIDGSTKAADDPRHFSRSPKQALEGRLVNIPNVTGHIEERPNFGTRGFGGREKLVKLRPASSLESLCEVRHNGNRCPLNLSSEPEILTEGTLSAGFIDGPSQVPCLLPSNQVLESFYPLR